MFKQGIEMIRNFYVLAVLTTAFSLTVAEAVSWRHVPVPGAIVHDLAVLPDGVVYAGTNDGLYRSENAGATWTRTQSSSPSKQFLRVHVVDGDPQKLVAYTLDTTQYGTLALEASRDGGMTWQVTFTYPLNFSSGDFTSHPAEPGVILFSESHVELRSDDGGMTWANLTPDHANQAKRVVFPIADQPGRYVAPSYRVDRMFESNDGGATWTDLELQPHIPLRDYTRYEQDPLQPSLLYYAAYEFGGQAALSGKLDSRTGVVSPFIDNCGCTHVRVVPDPHRPGRLIAPSIAFDALTLAVTGRPVRESFDGGATWHELSRLPRKLEDDYRWQFDRWQAGRIYLPTGGAGIYRSDDDGLSFTARYQGMDAGVVTDLSVDPTDPSDFMVVRQLLPMLHTSDGGHSFSSVRMDFYSDFPRRSEDRSRIARAWAEPGVVIGFDENTFYRSENGGRSWQRLPSDFPFGSDIWVDAVQFSGPGTDRLVALTYAEAGRRMYWSNDGGAHWTSSDFASSPGVNRLGTGGNEAGPVYARRDSYMPEQETLWVADAFGGTPRFVAPPSPEVFMRWNMSAPDPSNAFRVLAFSYDWSGQNRPREVFETLDAGRTWQRLGRSNIIGGIPVVDACDGRTVWETIMGRVSRDSGRSFGAEVDFAQYLAHGFHALCIEGRSHVLTVSARGVSIREPEAGDTLLKEGHDP